MSVLLLAMTAGLSGVEVPVLDRDVRRASRSNGLSRREPYRRDQSIWEDYDSDTDVRPAILTSNINYFADKIFAARRFLGKGFKLAASLGSPPAKGGYRGQVKFRMVYTGSSRTIEYVELVPYSPDVDLNRLVVEKIGDMRDRASRGLRMMVNGDCSIAVL